MFECHVCGLSPGKDGVTVYRQDREFGKPSLWACAKHDGAGPLDPETTRLIRTLERVSTEPAP